MTTSSLADGQTLPRTGFWFHSMKRHVAFHYKIFEYFSILNCIRNFTSLRSDILQVATLGFSHILGVLGYLNSITGLVKSYKIRKEYEQNQKRKWFVFILHVMLSSDYNSSIVITLKDCLLLWSDSPRNRFEGSDSLKTTFIFSLSNPLMFFGRIIPKINFGTYTKKTWGRITILWNETAMCWTDV
jgi:hypothetical protein